MKTVNRFVRGAVAAVMLVGLVGCANMSTHDKNMAVGAGIGAVGGAILTGGSPLGTVGGALAGMGWYQKLVELNTESVGNALDDDGVDVVGVDVVGVDVVGVDVVGVDVAIDPEGVVAEY